MDDTWRKAIGTKIATDGSAIRLSVKTVDGRELVIQIVPEMIPHLVAELMNAKTRAELLAAGPADSDGPIQPTNMRQPINAVKLVRTNYTERGKSLVQVLMAGGGVFEFLVPLDAGEDRTV